jgi:signal transduction histidine kinase
MSALTRLRRFIVGRRFFILSHLQFKRIVLTGQLAILVFVVSAAYAAFDILNGVHGSWPYEVLCALFALISFTLNRRGLHTAAKIILLLAANLTVYVFAASESVHTDLDVLFVALAIAAIAGFGYEQRHLAIIFVVMTVLLYLASMYIDFKPIEELNYDPGYAKGNKTVNFIAGIVVASLIVFALTAINFGSEKALRETEHQMNVKTEELTRLNMELDRFVYSSSHDLTAPLRSILGLITLSNLTEDREELKKYLTMMKERVTELDKSIKEMTDYKRNAITEITFTDIPVKKMIRDVLETLQFYPHAQRLAIEINIEDELTVCTDRTRLKVILSNIVSNCFKYCDLKKKEPFVRIMAGQKNDFMHLQVVDNGLGINQASLPKIFDMFYRAHEHGEGTGLGLYIVKEVVDKLGGTIAVHSSVGHGTTFNITLPTNVTKYKKI